MKQTKSKAKNFVECQFIFFKKLELVSFFFLAKTWTCLTCTYSNTTLHEMFQAQKTKASKINASTCLIWKWAFDIWAKELKEMKMCPPFSVLFLVTFIQIHFPLGDTKNIEIFMTNLENRKKRDYPCFHRQPKLFEILWPDRFHCLCHWMIKQAKVRLLPPVHHSRVPSIVEGMIELV
jgi:hypothetical protein